MTTLTDTQIAGVIKTAGFPSGSQVTAVAIALAESGGRSDATNRNSNGSTDYGLFQINSVHSQLLASGSWSDPVSNAKMALSVSSNGSNFKPWVAYTTQRYRIFLPRAIVAVGHADNVPDSTNNGGITPVDNPLGSLSAVFDPHTYLRIGMFVFGGVLLLVGLAKLTNIDNQVASMTKKVVKVAAI